MVTSSHCRCAFEWVEKLLLALGFPVKPDLPQLLGTDECNRGPQYECDECKLNTNCNLFIPMRILSRQ